VQYIVDVSVVGADYRAILFANQCRDAEEAFEASGVNYTHLRCSAGFENMLGSAGTIKSENKFYLPYGEGSIPRLVFVCLFFPCFSSLLGCRSPMWDRLLPGSSPGGVRKEWW
jgi:uncharacterized protein YbjT (DUF2867 family)